jgi:5-methylcytosine-specific restriction endonuclease McrA
MGKSLSITNWKNIRNKILDRDNYMCRICHKSTDEASLNVHHKDWDRNNNKNDNLVTLCSGCHKAVHREGYKPCFYEDYPEPWG